MSLLAWHEIWHTLFCSAIRISQQNFHIPGVTGGCNWDGVGNFGNFGFYIPEKTSPEVFWYLKKMSDKIMKSPIPFEHIFNFIKTPRFATLSANFSLGLDESY